MSTTTLKIIPVLDIPDFLIKEIGAKLAYVDDTITGADVSVERGGIVLHLNVVPDAAKTTYLTEKTNVVVSSLVSGAFEPRLRVLVDKTDRPVAYDRDPMETLLPMREVVVEEHPAGTAGTVVTVALTPTYSGCPAMATMRDDLVRALTAAGFDEVRV